MLTVHKFNLHLADEQEIKLPQGAIVLHADDQAGYLTIWVLLNPQDDRVPWQIAIKGTGHPVDPQMLGHFVRTVLMREGRMAGLVWHVFARRL